MDCDTLDLRQVSFEDLPAIIIQCGPSMIERWIRAFDNGQTPDAGDVTAEQLAELRRLERDLRASEARERRQRLLIPVAIFATVFLLRR